MMRVDELHEVILAVVIRGRLQLAEIRVNTCNGIFWRALSSLPYKLYGQDQIGVA